MGMIRVTLALAVLLSHLPPATFHFIGGGLAVQGFFIVSGFYMALVVERKYKDIGLFYSNRLLRLFPAYLVMMALAAIALFGFDASATASRGVFETAFGNPATALILGLQNLSLIGQDMLYWFTLSPEGALVLDTSGPLPTAATSVAWQALLVPQSWSLSMELLFYALAPFLARLDWRWIAALAAASIALRFGNDIFGVAYGLWQGRFFPTALFLFLFGMLAHRALPFAARSPKAIGSIACAGLLALLIFAPLFNLPNEPARWVVYFAIASATPFVFNASKDLALDRWIGDLSYPIYLTHLLVVGVVLTYELPFAMWTAIGATLALSAALLVLVDHPVDRWRQRRATQRTTIAVAPGAMSAA